MPVLIRIFLGYCMLLCLTSCSKDLECNVSDCIESKIKDFKKAGSTCDNGASVEQYTFQGQVVYTFFQGDCGADFASIVLTESCVELGALGGFSGNKIINGEDFANAVFVDRVWSN